mmetsp:Transcript_2285/g.11111  ORF Transcript_2285/g.11111 Transcript_2285/m.11111 type:complete len:253 (+) Transcript_2285:4059-4817(+)
MAARTPSRSTAASSAAALRGEPEPSRDEEFSAATQLREGFRAMMAAAAAAARARIAAPADASAHSSLVFDATTSASEALCSDETSGLDSLGFVDESSRLSIRSTSFLTDPPASAGCSGRWAPASTASAGTSRRFVSITAVSVAVTSSPSPPTLRPRSNRGDSPKDFIRCNDLADSGLLFTDESASISPGGPESSITPPLTLTAASTGDAGTSADSIGTDAGTSPPMPIERERSPVSIKFFSEPSTRSPRRSC